jgi:hypothetical protein
MALASYDSVGYSCNLRYYSKPLYFQYITNGSTLRKKQLEHHLLLLRRSVKSIYTVHACSSDPCSNRVAGFSTKLSVSQQP